ncbi:MAG TPA: hypothetical protein PKK61_07555 [Defluviitaleaceae bacterium]|nr:hypothetical protein [Defluviitaleaceae bacterium]
MIVGEIKAHVTEIEKEVPMSGEIEELRDIINEEIKDLLKFTKNN